MTIPDPEALAEDVASAIKTWTHNTPRTQQSRNHQIGVSDLGFCREFTRLMIIEEEFTDDPPIHKAFIGTWLGEGIETAIKSVFPDVRTGMKTTVALPSGITLTGHPDLVLPGGVLDVKTVDGLTHVKRNGPSEQQQFQRHCYAAGLVQNGELDEDCFVGNIWFDRSGRDEDPYVNVESYDPTWLKRADEWLDDVHYAVKNNERASQDKPLEFCEQCCEYFSICRGEDARKDREAGGLITDVFTQDYVSTYIEARDAKKAAEKRMEDARRALAGVSGSTGEHMVRWKYVGESEVPGHTRAAYESLDVRKLPKPKGSK